jgi:hypothetical protein
MRLIKLLGIGVAAGAAYGYADANKGMVPGPDALKSAAPYAAAGLAVVVLGHFLLK